MLQFLQKKVNDEERWYREEKLKEDNPNRYDYERDDAGFILPRDRELTGPK